VILSASRDRNIVPGVLLVLRAGIIGSV